MRAIIPLLLGVTAVGCATQQPTQAPAPRPAPASADSTPKIVPGAGALSIPNADPFPSTYRPFPSRTTVIRNATIMTAAGPTLRGASILLRDGKVAAVGSNLDVPSDAVVVDGTGKFVTPGIIDTHSHLGVYPAPGVDALSDGNEMTNPATPNVWAEHSVYAYGIDAMGGDNTLLGTATFRCAPPTPPLGPERGV